jgi:hypothetical protein
MFNWCLGSPDWAEYFNWGQPWFRNAYVRPYSDPFTGSLRQRFHVEIVANNPSASPGTYDCWTVYVYNYSQGAWNQFDPSSCGTGSSGAGPKGWVMHESFHVNGTYQGLCIENKTVAALSPLVRVMNGSTPYWQSLGNQHIYNGSTLHIPFATGSTVCWSDIAGGPWTMPEWYYSPNYPDYWRSATASLSNW